MGLFKSFSDKENARNQKLVDQILALDEEMKKLTDEELRNKTQEFKNRLDKGETLDDLLVEAFAVTREASDRTLKLKHYPVQLLGGIVLHNGQIAEQKTGEGKTLTETLPAYLNALIGKGVHIITVNDYLAKRDKEQMEKIYGFLGLTTGFIQQEMTQSERQENYSKDIIYGTNNQYGFDYLRDNMITDKNQKAQRDLYYAIVDEVDSILIDEARTPLIISGEGDDSSELYIQADEFVKDLEGKIVDPNEENDPFERKFIEEPVDYLLDEKKKAINLTGQGTKKAENFFGVENLADIENLQLSHYINNALRANYVMKRDVDYIVNKNKEVDIVDEFTGRIMKGRRFSDGLHQAIEAKENVGIKAESKTLATITFQNFFRMYDKLSGMTGTAMTEEDEFREIYNLDVVAIPTNKPVIRKDEQDVLFLGEEGKYKAIIEEIEKTHKTGQPILVGTTSIEKSEKISDLLKKKNIKHTVLNAKQHEREAEIIAQAGQKGSVTIATNMAGRGTDILLGGNLDFLAKKELRKIGTSEQLIEESDAFGPTENQEILDVRKQYRHFKDKYRQQVKDNAEEVKQLGGLYVIGTERHDSRRIDNQLRGRSGRQGDPGRSKFFLSMEDDLIRLNNGESIQNFIERMNFPKDEAVSARMLTKSVEKAQLRVEANNFSIRKRTIQYDDVMNKQRTVIYEERNRVLNGENIHKYMIENLKEIITLAVNNFTTNNTDMKHWNADGLMEYLSGLNLDMDMLIQDLVDNNEELNKETNQIQEKISDLIFNTAMKQINNKIEGLNEEEIVTFENQILLHVIDIEWVEHLDLMEQMKKEINVRAMGNEDPIRAYTNEGFDMFEELIFNIKENTVRTLLGATIKNY